MTIIIAILLFLGYILIALTSLTKVNKAAVAMFVGTLGWMLYISFGTDFVMAQHSGDYMDFLRGTTANSTAVKEYIAQNIFIQYVGKAAEMVMFLLATMTIVEILNNNGCFDFIQQWIRTRNSRRLLWLVAVVTLIISANLDNMTAVLMMLIVIHKLMSNSRQMAVFASVIMLSATIGGALTVIGDTNGLLLWNLGAVTPSYYSVRMALPCLVAWWVPIVLIGRRLPERVDIQPSPLPYRGDDTNLSSWQRILMLLFGIGGLWFIPTFHNITKLSPFVGALCVLSLLWIVNEAFNRNIKTGEQMAERRVPRILQYGILQMILFVMGIMLVMGLFVETGIARMIGNQCMTALGDIWPLLVAPMLAGSMSLCVDSFATAAAFFSLYPIGGLEDCVQNGDYWIAIAYTTAVGGAIFGIGSVAGIAMFKMEDMSLGWYVRYFTPKVLIGALLGLAVLIIEVMYF